MARAMGETGQGAARGPDRGATTGYIASRHGQKYPTAVNLQDARVQGSVSRVADVTHARRRGGVEWKQRSSERNDHKQVQWMVPEELS